MSGFDNVNFNTRERPMSADQNDLQSFIHREVLDCLQQLATPSVFSAAVPAESPAHMVLGGLMMTPNGNNVDVLAGALCQYSATVTPTPGSLDSSYRIGINRSTATVTTPSPVSNTFYLLTARMTQVITSVESRDIMNAVTGNFEPAMVTKKVERQLEFRFEAGSATNFPIPSDSDWKVIGGVFRPAGGGAVLATHLYDMRGLRNLKSAYNAAAPGHLSRRSYTAGKFTSSSAQGAYKFSTFDVDGQLNGQDVWIHSPLASRYELMTLTAQTCDAVNDPRGLSAGSWYYMYLAPFAGIMPVGQQHQWEDETTGLPVVLGGAAVRGVLVESTVAPLTQGQNTNGATITLPAPFANQTVAAGGAILVGAFLRSETAGFLPCTADGPDVDLKLNFRSPTATLYQQLLVNDTGSWPGGSQTISVGADAVPLSARKLKARGHWVWKTRAQVNRPLSPFEFTTSQTRADPGGMDFFVLSSAPTVQNVQSATDANGGTYHKEITHLFPVGSQINRIRMRILKSAATAVTLELVRIDGYNHTLGDVTTPTITVVDTQTVSTIGMQTLALDGLTETTVLGATYHIRVRLAFSGDVETFNYGFQLIYTPPARDKARDSGVAASTTMYIKEVSANSASTSIEQTDLGEDFQFNIDMVDPNSANGRVASFIADGGSANDDVNMYVTGFSEAI